MEKKNKSVVDVQGQTTTIETTVKSSMSNERVNEVSPFFLEHFDKLWAKMSSEDKKLVHFINERIVNGRFMSEKMFRDVWQNGLYYVLNCCSTKEKYCKFLRDYVEKYGTPLKEDVVMYRAIRLSIESKESISGGSWTKDIKSAFEYSARYGCKEIYSMTIPKGTKTIHFHGTLLFPESEDLIDTIGVKNDSLALYASLNKVIQKNYKKWVAYYTKPNGNIIPHVISNMYSKELSETFLNNAA